MKKRWILALFILWSLAAGQWLRVYENEKERVAQVFAQVGTGEQTCVVEYYGVYEKEPLELAEREMFLREIAEELQIEEPLEITRKYEEQKEETILRKTGSQAKTTLRMITRQEQGEEQQYVILNITMKSGMKMALDYREKLERLMKPYAKNSHSSANVIGTYPGKMTLKQRNAMADELLRELGAKVVSENRDMRLYTIYAYTPWLTDYVMQDHEAVNVNIAMYYSEARNQTCVYGAVPLAGLDY